MAEVVVDQQARLVTAPYVHAAHIRKRLLAERVDLIEAECGVADHPAVEAAACRDAGVEEVVDRVV